MKFLQALSVAAMIVLGGVGVSTLPACSYFGVVQPKSFEDNVLLVQSGVREAQEGLSAKISADSIKKADAENVAAQLRSVNEALDVAIELRSANDPRAEDKLAAASASLAIIRKYLGV